MKKLIYLITLGSITLLSSCSGPLKTERVTSTNATGTLKIDVFGKRNNSVDAFKAYTEVIRLLPEGNDTIKGAFTEVYASDLTSENVRFDWSSEERCVISLEHRDGKVNKVPVFVQARP